MILSIKAVAPGKVQERASVPMSSKKMVFPIFSNADKAMGVAV